MSAHVVIACDGKTEDGRRCKNGSSRQGYGRQLAAYPVRDRLKKDGWKSVKHTHRMPFIRKDGSAGTSTYTEVHDYCPEHVGQIPPVHQRTTTHELTDYRKI